jgi:hypothetical protein
MEHSEKHESLDVHAERLEALAGEGIAHPERAAEVCRRIRTELYGLQQALIDIYVPDGPRGPSAA